MHMLKLIVYGRIHLYNAFMINLYFYTSILLHMHPLQTNLNYQSV